MPTHLLCCFTSHICFPARGALPVLQLSLLYSLCRHSSGPPPQEAPLRTSLSPEPLRRVPSCTQRRRQMESRHPRSRCHKRILTLSGNFRGSVGMPARSAEWAIEPDSGCAELSTAPGSWQHPFGTVTQPGPSPACPSPHHGPRLSPS